MSILPAEPVMLPPLIGGLDSFMTGIVAQSGAAMAEIAAGLPSAFGGPSSLSPICSRINAGAPSITEG
jgi:hypothetical protein